MANGLIQQPRHRCPATALVTMMALLACGTLCQTQAVVHMHSSPVQSLPAVSKLNVSMYVGRWFQVFASATVQWTMELGGRCVTADYAVSATRSDVLTVQNAVSVLGVPVKVNGYGIVNPKHAGELDVNLGPPGHGPDPKTAGSFKNTNYLVFGLGPIIEEDNHARVYDYALVSDPSAITLYVLARNVSRFTLLYEADVLSKLKEMNFTSFLKRPRRSNQNDCTYVPQPPI